VLASSAPSADVDELLAAARDLAFRVFVMAFAGSGGRGMGGLDDRTELAWRFSCILYASNMATKSRIESAPVNHDWPRRANNAKVTSQGYWFESDRGSLQGR
jgi:hypothetical protein